MKCYKRTWTILITAACAFCVSMPIGAQDTEPTPTNPDSQPAAEQPTVAPAEPEQPAAPATDNAPEPVAPLKPGKHRKRHTNIQKNAIVEIGKNVELKADETADAVVVIGGSAVIRGKVNEAVVAVGGDVDIEGGEVGDAAVAVLGNVKAGRGATVNGDAVSVGGTLSIDPEATVLGQKNSVGMTGFHPLWLRNWFVHCGLMLRPLAPQVGWVWVVVGAFFLFYLFVAAVFPRPVLACVNELTTRPATTFFMGLLTKLLLPLVILILIATVVGTFVIPFILAALFLGAIVGKVALLEWLGLKIGGQVGAGPAVKPLLALTIGGALIALVYMIPILGLVTFGVLSVWGLGGAVMATFGGLRREIPAKSTPPPSTPAAVGAPVMVASAATSAGESQAGFPPVAEPATDVGPAAASTATAIATPAVLPETLSYPKAGFWERMGAAFLDLVLVGISGALVGPFVPIVVLAYFSAMWAWKGTTIGGIVIGLKVVRFDGQPVTFAVALVRALAGAFSIFVLFLGILWIAWDSEKQGWHDKIAGTLVLKLPRGTPLVCL